MLLAAIHAYMTHSFVWNSVQNSGRCGDFTVGDLWSSGAAAFFLVVLGVNLTLALQHSAHLIITVIPLLMSVLSFPVTMHIASTLPVGRGLSGCAGYLFGSSCLNFWVSTLGFIVALFVTTTFFLECPLLRHFGDKTPAELLWADVANMLRNFGVIGAEVVEERVPPETWIEMGDSDAREKERSLQLGLDSLGEDVGKAVSNRSTLPELPMIRQTSGRRFSHTPSTESAGSVPKRLSVSSFSSRQSNTTFSEDCQKQFRATSEAAQGNSTST